MWIAQHSAHRLVGSQQEFPASAVFLCVSIDECSDAHCGHLFLS